MARVALGEAGAEPQGRRDHAEAVALPATVPDDHAIWKWHPAWLPGWCAAALGVAEAAYVTAMSLAN